MSINFEIAVQGLRLKTLKAMYGFPPSTVYYWIEYQDFPKPIKLGRVSYWKKSSVDDWIASKADKIRVEEAA